MEMVRSENRPNSGNWEQSHSIKGGFKHLKLYYVSTKNLLVFFNNGQDGDDTEHMERMRQQSRRGEEIKEYATFGCRKHRKTDKFPS